MQNGMPEALRLRQDMVGVEARGADFCRQEVPIGVVALFQGGPGGQRRSGPGARPARRARQA